MAIDPNTTPGRTLVPLRPLLAPLLAAACADGEPDHADPTARPRGPTRDDVGEREPRVAIEIDALSPAPAPGGVAFDLRVTGAGFGPDARVHVGGVALTTTALTTGELLAACGPLPRGGVEVVVRRGDLASAPRWLMVDNAAPQIVVPAEVSVAEDEALVLPVEVLDLDDPLALRVLATGLPPGAVWDEPARVLRFTPDFTQGDRRFPVTFIADDGRARVEGGVDVVVVDTIRPPAPEIVDTEVFEGDGFVRYTLAQATDDYLDSPGHAGRSFAAVVTAPLDPPPEGVAVRIGLHGFGTPSPSTSGTAQEIRIAPHDPDDTYWWGYAESLPDLPPAAGGAVPDYTVRRVLSLLEWALRTFPEADPERVYVFGSSMGGAGAMTLGLLRARHFAYVDARLGQAIPRNHRPSRIAQLAALWGDPALAPPDRGAAAWDRMDLTRALLDAPEARDQFLFVRHAKDDPIIHFGAAVLPSPLTGESLYSALQRAHVGHFAVWDEGGHGPADPILGGGWWSDTWAPMADGAEPALRRDRSFPAFTRSSLDDDPGDGSGNGLQAWSDDAGYAGEVGVAGDCGWSGDLAGALGRSLRWRPDSIVDTVDRWQVDLRVLDGEGSEPPAPGYPSVGDLLIGDLPAWVDVTPRRVQAFRCRPGEPVTWSFGALAGEVTADDEGGVTIPDLPLTRGWQTLVLRRAARAARSG